MAVAAANAATTCEAPPTLVDPIVYQDKCPGDANFPSTVNAGGRDVYVRLPNNRQCTKRLLVQYARNVRITSGEFSYDDTAAYVIAVRRSSGTTMIDGISVNANGRDADAISTYAHTGRMIIQNTFVRGVKGTPGGTVRDVMEASTAGPLSELILQNVTALTGGRGLFASYNSGNGHGTSKLVLDHVNARHDTSLPSWPSGTAAPKLLHMGNPSSTTQQAPANGTTLSNVYVDGTYWGLPYQKTVYLEPKPQPDGCASFSSDKFTGKVCMAPPPGGADYAPAENVGLNYDRTRFCGQEAVNQCDVSQVPPQAAALGLTRLAFCDDFSSDSVARGTTAAARDITGGKKWTTERATWSTVPPTSADSFVFNADGTLTVTPNQQEFNWFMSSAVLRNAVLKGYWIAKKPRWYVEIRWKFQKAGTTEQQPAFWSMDACHLWGKPAACPNGDFIEPDFWEYYFAVWATHYYKQGPGDQSVARCNDQNPSYGVAENQWFTAGTLVTSVPEMKYYKNNQLTFTRKTTTPCDEANSSGIRTAGFITGLKNGDYPILIGSKDGERITIDYVRVWQHPSDA